MIIMHNSKEITGSDISVQLLTISDSRKIENDRSGELMKKYIEASPFQLAGYSILREDFSVLDGAYRKLLEEPGIDVIISSGGTGLSGRDRTIEVLEEILESRLDGFGEIFRFLSYEEIGPRAVLSRAMAGKANKKLFFALPGSPAAVRLGFEKIILEILKHAVEITLS